MSQSVDRILKRMRTEVKYSALATMTMRLLKANNLYVLSTATAKIARIKTQKNFGIIVLRLAILFAKLGVRFTRDEISDYAFTYLRESLQVVLRQKFQKRKGQNSEIFMETAMGLNLKDIDVLEKVFAADVDKPSEVLRSVQGLYERNEHGNFEREQLKSMNRLTEIVCTHSVKAGDQAATIMVMVSDVERQKEVDNEMISTGLQSQGSYENQIRIPTDLDIFLDEIFQESNNNNNVIDWFNDI